MNSNEIREEERITIVVVLSAIIILVGLLVYISFTPPQEETFSALYLLDSEKKAENYPQLLVLGKNNTFLLWVGVENFMDRIEHSSVLVKVDNGTGDTNPSPIDSVYRFEKILLDEETWEFPITFSINQTGQHRIIFELWLFDELDNVFSYSRSWCSIWINVIES